MPNTKNIKTSARGDGSSGDVPIIWMPVDRLFLDEENPRLGILGQHPTQEQLLRVLWKEMAVDEVAISIAVNGYFPEEPLFVIPRDAGTTSGREKYTVVEGNRRLAAVKLLLDPGLRERLKATDLPTVRQDKIATLRDLPVSIHSSRRELWEFLGFRHINGPQPWDAYSKAVYVAKVHEEYGIPIPNIALAIGDKHNTVSRFYRGFTLLRQAEEQAGFSKTDRATNELSFSHLYTAAAYSEFQQFLGITASGSLKTNPVPKTKLPELKELLVWLYGSKQLNKAPIIRSQNPDLNRLRAVVSAPSALSALRKGYSLERAYDVSVGEPERFREALVSAKEEMLQAKANVTTGYSGEPDLLQIVQDIVEISTSVRSEMEVKISKTAKRGRAS